MKNKLIKLFIFYFIIILNNILFSKTKSVYRCCSPYGQCDSQNYESSSDCKQFCGGINKCIETEIEVDEKTSDKEPTENVTVYNCCSPYNTCDNSNFSSLEECTQLCGGINKCIATQIEVKKNELKAKKNIKVVYRCCNQYGACNNNKNYKNIQKCNKECGGMNKCIATEIESKEPINLPEKHKKTKIIYRCCSPYNICDLDHNFDNQSDCIKNCGGINKCTPVEIEDKK